MFKTLLLSACFLTTSVLVAAAEDVTGGKGMTSVTHVYSQVVSYQLPPGFKPAYEDTKGDNYIQESTSDDESVEDWTYLITLTGRQNQAIDETLKPVHLANAMIDQYKPACPDTFATAGLGESKVDGHDAFWAYYSCGTIGEGDAAQSESAVIGFIKGDKDYYTIQYAEHGEASDTPIEYEEATWLPRMQSLMPFKLIEPMQ